MLQDDYRKQYKKINPRWEDSVSIYIDLVRKSIENDSVVLEAGCGFNNMFEKEYKRAKKVIGLDIDEKFLAMNKVIDEKVVAPLENMPQVKDESIDLIISSWVLEHIYDADKVFAEISRVLKPGGKFIFLTPNKWNYVVLLNRIISEKVRMFVVNRMAKNLTTDPMPAFYKANSVGKIRALVKKYGLSVNTLIINGDPTYVAINKLFFYIGILIDAILSLPLLRRTKVHLIAVIEKK